MSERRMFGIFPSTPLVVAIYGFVLGLAGGSFSLMGYHVFFVGRLVPESIAIEQRRREFGRSLIGSITYIVAAMLAFLSVGLSITILILIPIFFIVPRFLERTATVEGA